MAARKRPKTGATDVTAAELARARDDDAPIAVRHRETSVERGPRGLECIVALDLRPTREFCRALADALDGGEPRGRRRRRGGC